MRIKSKTFWQEQYYISLKILKNKILKNSSWAIDLGHIQKYRFELKIGQLSKILFLWLHIQNYGCIKFKISRPSISHELSQILQLYKCTAKSELNKKTK